MAQQFILGAIVKFKENLDPGDELQRFIVLDDWGYKVYVRRVLPTETNDMLPLFVVRKEEVVLA